MRISPLRNFARKGHPSPQDLATGGLRRVTNPLHWVALLGMIVSLNAAETTRVAYNATRLNNGEPIITKQMFNDAGVTGEGSNINGPSLIRVPDWIAPANRTHPDANYYLYFGDHDGDFIRMAWSATIAGPYTLFNVHSGTATPRGVLDLGGSDKISLANNLEIYDHISSPDVHVDDANQRIVLYFHGPAKHNGIGGDGLLQKTFVAYSNNGLDFNGAIEPVYLALAYLRVFDYAGSTYGIASRGALYTAPLDPDTPPSGFDFSRDLWNLESNSYTDNPFQDDLNGDPSVHRLRHVALRVNGDVLEVFHSRVGDSPERILVTALDLTVPGGISAWNPSYPPTEVLRPELEWEGTAHPLVPSGGGAEINVQQLRDPCLFEDTDGVLYLLYSGQGEEAIGIASLTPTDPPPLPSTPVPITSISTNPALVDANTEVTVETVLSSLTTSDGIYANLVGASSVSNVTGATQYFHQNVNPGTYADALTGLSLTTAVPNASADFLFAPDSGIIAAGTFFFFEIGGDDGVTIKPIDEAGNPLGPTHSQSRNTEIKF